MRSVAVNGARGLAVAGCLVLAGCGLLDTGPTPAQVQADIARRIPATVPDRAGWARDIQVALSALDLPQNTENACAVLAVIEQESTYQADPVVPGLGAIARKAIYGKAAGYHVPQFVVDAALAMDSPDGRTYARRLDAMRTERELSELFEEMMQRMPLGSGRLLARLNPVRTAGPMQVGIAFAQAHARGYPYPLDGSVRREVFTRRGGLYFGIKHLLGYRSSYTQKLHRFADYNAGWYASRNAGFQRAVAVASGRALALDGDLIRPGASLEAPGATEAAIRSLQPRIGLDAAAIRADLGKSGSLAFEDTPTYRAVYRIADARMDKPLPRARVPEIALSSPKITCKLTTAWFADRVNRRYRRCMARP